MKVLALSWEYPPYSVGGLASHLADLLPELSQLGAEIHLVTRGEDGAEEYQKEDGVHIYRVQDPQIKAKDFTSWVMMLNFKLLEKATEVMNQNQIDLIHSHDWLVALASKTLKHSYNVPVVTTIHATEAGRNNGIHNEEQRFINDIEWQATYEAWKIICCSDCMKDEMKDNFSLPNNKIEVIKNGVREENFTSKIANNIRKQYAWPDEKIIYFIGRLVQEKGVQVLLDALQEILGHQPRVRLIIAGDGPKRSDLEAQAAHLGIAQRVDFVGYARTELRNALYQMADVAVFPSLYEPFGIVALEAMVTKTPVVVSDIGGFDEIVKHQENGLKAYCNDSHSFAVNILKLLGDQGLAQKVVDNAYGEIQSEYNWTNIAQKTLGVYEEVLAEKRNLSSERGLLRRKFSVLK